MQIVGIGTNPASPATLPLVVVGDPPREAPNALCSQTPSICADYVSDIQANVALLAGDGLNVIYAENHSYMLGTYAEMNDQVHPNTLGQSELRQAFEAVIP
jgi:lysophospholipase L1-like esterase